MCNGSAEHFYANNIEQCPLVQICSFLTFPGNIFFHRKKTISGWTVLQWGPGYVGKENEKSGIDS